jgi:hypothetical protein
VARSRGVLFLCLARQNPLPHEEEVPLRIRKLVIRAEISTLRALIVSRPSVNSCQVVQPGQHTIWPSFARSSVAMSDPLL